MIRFTCPGCETSFKVGDEKAGKPGKCPKCQSQFTIICIVNGDVTNCVLGIVGLVLLGQEDVRRWYARRTWRY